MTQVGETVNVCVPEQAEPPKVLDMELESVEFDSSTKVSVKDATVKTPHWEKGASVIAPSGTSERPAALLFAANGGVKDVEVKINVTQLENISGGAKLVASLGGLEIEGTLASLSTGINTVSAKIKNLPDAISWFKGDAAFALEVDDLQETRIVGAARLEVFVVYKQPANYFQSKKGVWAEVLRFLCGPKGPKLVRKASEAQIAEAIVRYCHSRHKLKYDSAGGGGSSYGVSSTGGRFKLKEYMQRISPFANCYDQAGAIQSLCGAVGVPLQWIYLRPFGFLKKTRLLGYGSCNNPFFLRNGTRKLVRINNPKRTPFGNHAFGSLGGKGGKMLDACGGPHIGTETAGQYVDACVDSKTTLYSLYSSFRAGTKADMTEESGVTAVV